MSSLLEEYIKSVLHRVAMRYELIDWSYSLETFQTKAQNFFGTLMPATICGKKNGSADKLSVVLKLAPADERFRVSGAIGIFFRREIFMYEFALKLYKNLQKTLPTSQYVIPECYYTCDRKFLEVIAMQDMRGEGFQPHVHAEFLDLNHLELAMVSLANFHALSFILKYKDAESHQRIATECPPLNGQTNKRFMDIMKDRLQKAMEQFAETRYEEIFKTLLEVSDKLFVRIYTSVSNTCICHGDLWKENIMFKYNKENVPVAACVIDYQTCRVGSPASDFIYLLLSSSDSKLRSPYTEPLKHLYFQTLSLILNETGLEHVYSKEMFEKDCELVTPACVIMANTALWLASGMQQVGHVRSKQLITTDTKMAAAVEKYKELIRGIVSEDFLTENVLESPGNRLCDVY